MAAPVRRPHGVLGGLVIIAFGVPFLLALPPFTLRNASLYLFITVGLAFLAAYLLGTRQFIYLMPAATLLAFGVGLLLPTWYPPMKADLAGPMLLATQAVGFVVVWALGRDRWWVLVPAAVLGVVAAAEGLGRMAVLTPGAEPYLVPVLLIGVGAYLLKS